MNVNIGIIGYLSLKLEVTMKKLFLISILFSFLFVSCSEDEGTTDNDDGLSVSVFVEGAKFHGANGIYFGPDGYLYVASLFGRDISALDVSTGTIVKRYSVADQVETPDDVVFGPDGSMYWTDLFTGNIGRRYPDGSVKKTVRCLRASIPLLSPKTAQGYLLHAILRATASMKSTRN